MSEIFDMVPAADLGGGCIPPTSQNNVQTAYV